MRLGDPKALQAALEHREKTCRASAEEVRKQGRRERAAYLNGKADAYAAALRLLNDTREGA